MLLTRPIVCILAAVLGCTEASRSPRKTRLTVVSLNEAIASSRIYNENGDQAVDSIKGPEHDVNSFESKVGLDVEEEAKAPKEHVETLSEDSSRAIPKAVAKALPKALITTLPIVPKEVPETPTEPIEGKEENPSDKKDAKAPSTSSESYSGENVPESSSGSAENVPPPVSTVQPRRFKCDMTGAKTLVSKGIQRVKDTRTITKVVTVAALGGATTYACYCAGIVDGSLIIDYGKPVLDGICAAGSSVCGYFASGIFYVINPVMEPLGAGA